MGWSFFSSSSLLSSLELSDTQVCEPRIRALPGTASLIRRNVKRCRGGLVFKAHRLLYRSTIGSREIKKQQKEVAQIVGWSLSEGDFYNYDVYRAWDFEPRSLCTSRIRLAGEVKWISPQIEEGGRVEGWWQG